ncbi:unnamed protein product, partial [Mesorhabditis belari]|uniref:Protein kinase domain-containing protein n=1 Tax=Mesorhabditis belari TaxID=2138241 RepID=A0AAF3J3U0_9BILA
MESNATVIGRGTFGFVVLAGGHPKIAAKYILKGQTAIFKKEQEAMEKLSHPNIVKFYGFGEDEYFNIIKMEYCERNSLLQILDDPSIIYSMVTAICWGEHMFAALKHLEKVGILHRDIKPENVLVDHQFILKLADFGCVRDSKSAKSFTSVGTLRYMSPETAGALGISQSTLLSDVYAVGLILWEIIERRRVYSEYGLNPFSQQSLFRDILDKKTVLSDPNCVQDGIKDFIRRSTSFYPNDRPRNDESLSFWSNLREKYGIETFLPIIDPQQKSLIRPIGFDGTLNRVALEEDWISLSH